MQSGALGMIALSMHVGPSSAAVWRAWSLEPSIALALGATVWLYARGTRAAWRRAGRGRGVRRWQVWCFVAGIATLLVAVGSPIDAMSAELFSAHMTQHVLLATIAPPFLVAGAPALALLWAVPTPYRRLVARRVTGVASLQRCWSALTLPLVAWLLHALAIWIWHTPRAYELALRHPSAHVLEHACFVGTAVLLWWRIVYPRERRRNAYAVGLLLMFGTAMHSGALGALLVLSTRSWYTVHGGGPASWGLTALADQQLAGLIMWVAGGLLYVIAMSVLFVAWLSASDAAGQRRRKRDREAVPLGISARVT